MAETIKQSLVAGAGYGAAIRISPRSNSGPVYPTVKAIPGSGGTMLVQYTTSTPEDVAAATATWTNWPAGSVSAATSDSLLGAIMFIQASATTANGTLEVCQ
jgi:hypothetical protein